MGTVIDTITLPRTSLWNLAEMDRDYKCPRLPATARTVIDIGAHAGIFALFALSEWKDARIICYEPHPEIVSMCRANLAGLNAEVHERAVIGAGDVAGCVGGDGKAVLYEGKRTLLGSSLHHLGWQRDAEAARVEWLPAVELPEADILKLDVEGSELPILRDFRHGASVSALLVEVHRRAEFPKLAEIAWGWGLDMVRCNVGRNGCATSVWVR